MYIVTVVTPGALPGEVLVILGAALLALAVVVWRSAR